ncbi:hypothetical protein KR093_008130, partial [Drosophila rubida]
DGRMEMVRSYQESVKNDEPVVGIATKDGVVLVGSKISLDTLIVSETYVKTTQLSKHVAATFVGMNADFRQLCKWLGKQFYNYKLKNRKEMTLKALAKDLGEFMQETILLDFIRPYATNVLLGGWTECGDDLYLVDCFGMVTSAQGICLGRNSQKANTFLQGAIFKKITLETAIPIAIQAIRVALNARFLCPFEVCLAVINCDGYRNLGNDEVQHYLSVFQTPEDLGLTKSKENQ